MPAYPRPRRSDFSDRTVKNALTGDLERLQMSAVGRNIRLRDATGCSATRALDWFSPSATWKNCGTSSNWHTGQGRVRVLDPLYPLQVGATGLYWRSARSHTGKTSVRTTECRVTDAVTIAIGSRPENAFVVKCDDGRVERTTWYAPGAGPLAYHEAKKGRSPREAWVVAR